ncbi:Gfo/Idh/MocA family oxidoreductase [Rhodospirillaceae bacterium KN72]|uniref:Gfo/Idh/MocA family oxidoreductase n=1 Tax=Pacificispira spongiicola TaxID=2729598 RepID=A0A7Y0HF95_9PROT|nr:Gfo/Idh/MocA family oxidoreductase [Pacificispira spongiicola]NMM45590.1 Gfo/Idh/MocA family oxidoreductase [Pacificispira spongiicola]
MSVSSGQAGDAIVVGFGSIGARHADVLGGLGFNVSVVSRRSISEYPRYSDIRSAIADYPGAYIVIATETSAHGDAIADLQGAGHTGRVMIEKPLFGALSDLRGDVSDDLRKRIAVGYNLRFHPLVGALKERLTGRAVFLIEAAVGQYLPDWRPQRDYRSGYSARRAGGGGVLRDLSHEIDYLLWLFGPWRRVAALTGTTGQLEIDSEDYASILVKGRDFPAATLALDYLDRAVRRYVTVQHDGGTTCLDFVAGTLTENGAVVAEAKPGRNETYIRLHEAMRRGEESALCSFDEGMDVLRIIEAVERAASTESWATV